MNAYYFWLQIFQVPKIYIIVKNVRNDQQNMKDH